MEATLNGRCSHSVLRPVEQGRGSGHGNVTTLRQGLLASTAASLEKIFKHLNVTCSLVQVWSWFSL